MFCFISYLQNACTDEPMSGIHPWMGLAWPARAAALLTQISCWFVLQTKQVLAPKQCQRARL